MLCATQANHGGERGRGGWPADNLEALPAERVLGDVEIGRHGHEPRDGARTVAPEAMRRLARPDVEGGSCLEGLASSTRRQRHLAFQDNAPVLLLAGVLETRALRAGLGQLRERERDGTDQRVAGQEALPPDGPKFAG